VVVLTPQRGKDATEWVSLGATTGELQETLNEALGKTFGLLSPVEIVDRRYGIEAFLDPTRRPVGVKTGFTELDEATVGLHPGELILLGGRPAAGKTSLGMCIARNVAASRKAVGVFSLEMGSESLLDRMICCEARVPYMAFRKAELNSQQRTALMRAHYEISQWPLRIDDTAGMTLDVMAKRLELMRSEIGLSFVLVDYLQLLRSKGKIENRNQEVGAISRGLKLMAKEFQVPIMALSQLNRASDANAGSRPNMANLRDSGSLEQDADMVWFCHRPEVYKPDDMSLEGLAEIIIAKQRNGPIGIRRLKFWKEYTLFTNEDQRDRVEVA
jgi:replicative DNA helicase